MKGYLADQTPLNASVKIKQRKFLLFLEMKKIKGQQLSW